MSDLAEELLPHERFLKQRDYERLDSDRYQPPQRTAIIIPLDELQRLIDEFCDFKAGDSTDGLRRLFLRGFVDWMREKEKSNERQR